MPVECLFLFFYFLFLTVNLYIYIYIYIYICVCIYIKWLLLATLVVPKNIKSQGNFGNNQFHNILRHFDVLQNFPFTTSEAMGNYYL